MRLFPSGRFGSAVFAIALTCLLTMALAYVSTEKLESYGLGLFAGLPFVLGFLSAMLHGVRQPRSLGDSLMVGMAAILVVGGLFLGLALEGLICPVMAFPIAVPLVWVGALAGHMTQPARFVTPSPHTLCAALLAFPVMVSVEPLSPEAAPLLKVRTQVEVAAPPETVWKHVVTFSNLPEPTDWLFRIGVAYPIHAEIEGYGEGPVRRCVFSTGPFVEPVEIWDEPRLLAFSVTGNPPPLEEWTPYDEVHPPHLHGFLESERGQFLLTPLPGSRTLLEGTTYYRHNLWPVAYWQLWSDFIIHRIHLRVLNHVKGLSEAEPKFRLQ